MGRVMILVTGGTGFIGSHTVRALLERGEDCVLMQRRAGDLPAVLDGAPDGAQLLTEPGSVTDLDALLAVGSKHPITGIVHLAGTWPTDPDAPFTAVRTALDGLLHVLEAGQRWGVRRIGVASTIGVYSGLDVAGGITEDTPLPMTAPHVIPTFKKIGEMLNDHLSDATGLDIVNYRISATWGPGGHSDPFFAAPHLVHAAARGTAPDLSDLLQEPHTDDAIDLNYVRDTGRAIAALQLAETLHHRTYNVASGRATTNAEILDALADLAPDVPITLAPGGAGPHTHLDITRLREDTGYEPDYDLTHATADYLDWLRAGHER